MGLRGAQVARVGSDQHDLLGAQIKQVWRHQIGLDIWLVVTDKLGREDQIPRQSGPLCHVGQEGYVAVGERRDDVPFLQTREPGDGVRPGVETMPSLIEVVSLLFRQAFDAELFEQLFEGGAVEGVEVGPWQFAAPDPVHGRSVAAAPLVGEGGPVDIEVLLSAELLALPDHRTAPVHHGAEHVEDERLDDRVVHYTSLCTCRSPAASSATSIASSDSGGTGRAGPRTVGEMGTPSFFMASFVAPRPGSLKVYIAIR